jgi:hypothetical protein
MKKQILILSFFSLIITISSCSDRSKIEKEIEAINKDLPAQQGSMRADKIEMVHDTIKYYYTILTDAVEKPNDENTKQAKMIAIATVKTNPAFKKLLNDNLFFSFVYRKSDGSIFWQVQVSPEDYK